MNKEKYTAKNLQKTITSLVVGIFFLFNATQVNAATCPFFDNGVGDDDQTTNGIITISTNKQIDASNAIADSGEFDCSTLDFLITNSATLTMISYNNGDENYSNDFGVTLRVRSLTVESNAVITSMGQGYAGGALRSAGKGPGGGQSVGTSSFRGNGAGHGGYGASVLRVSDGGAPYGTWNAPLTLGSGGGGGDWVNLGARGGGAIKIVAIEEVVVDGLITVDGNPGIGVNGNNEPGGAGSGGSIFIETDSLSGSGQLSAKGGNGFASSLVNSGGGGGGRIYINYSDTNSFNGTISVAGGTGGNTTSPSDHGTAGIYNESNDHLYILTNQRWFANPNLEGTDFHFNEITVSNNATWQLEGYYTNNDDGKGFSFSTNAFTVESGSTVSGIGLGYKGKVYPSLSDGLGAPQTAGTRGAGAGHAGSGANTSDSTGGSSYGNSAEPITLGSGGGGGSFTTQTLSGSGGSALKISANGVISINGIVDMSGSNGIGVGGNCTAGGGGSGGSIFLSAGTLSGGGTIASTGGGGGIGSGNTICAGGGSGGRIALYHVTQNQFQGEINRNGGINGSTAAANGSLVLGGFPGMISTPQQYQADGTTQIAVGGTANNNTIIITVGAQDGDSSDTLRAEVEKQVVGVSFTNTPTDVSNGVSYTGESITISTSVSDLTDATEYHWQIRVCDTANHCSQWISFGENSESEPDFNVVLNQAPNLPIIPGSSAYIHNAHTNDTTPTFLFTQSDSDSGNQVRYRIQVATSSDFSSPTVEYTSALGDQGPASFTVGQNTSGGSYQQGSQGQVLPEGEYFWRIKTIDEVGAESDWVTAEGNPAFTVDTTSPTNVISTRMKAYAGHSVTHEDDANPIWFGREDVYFGWDTSGDTSILKGYCVYIGTDEEADPSSQKGLLGTSPITTTGSNCQFITDDTEIDFSNTALRGNPWLSSSNSAYYFKIRPIDLANNVGTEDTENSTFRFYFDSTPPNNVTTISASSGSMSSIADMNFYWPTSGTQYATDVGSGILGFQYAVNSTDVWRGVQTDPTTGLTYIPPGYSQPFYLNPDIVGDDIIVGSNVLYFRTVDVAGNTSNYTTAPLEYGGEAPAFPNNATVTINPNTNTKNEFSFSWPEATPSDGRTVATYYYMVNTPPPALFSTITSNSSVYVPTTTREVAALSLPNARKGSNTIYVVAVDDSGNYSQSNYISGTFTLNSTLPDPPNSVVVSDASVKSASLWRASLAWSKPDYTGTDNLKYVVQRSNDGSSWSNISETTGLAFLDILSASQKYFWRIGAFDSSDESIASPSYSNAVFLTPKGAYTEPANLTSGPSASSITTKRATINWTTARASDSKISIGTESKKYNKVEPSDSTQTTEHSLALTTLEPGTIYYYVAKWTDEDGNTGVSEEKTFKTDPPPTVKDVEIKNVGIDSALIEFTTIGASSVKISYGKSTEFGGIKTISTATNEATYSVQLSDLEDGTKYYFKIDTQDEEDDTYEGTILNFETLPRPEISNVRVQQIANTAQSSIQVSWESNTPISSIITFYPESNPEYARDAVDITLREGEHEMVVPGLLPETPYILIVKGRDRLGNEAVSDRLRFTTATDTRPPKISDMVIEGSNVPQVSTAAQGSNSQLIVTWTTDEPATSQIEYGEGAGTTYSQITQEDQTLKYNHLVIVSGLTSSKVYHLRAISKDSAGNIAKSVDTVTITPKTTDNAFDLVITNLREVFGFLGNL